MRLNTTNPDSLIYENDLLKLTVLGGIKLDGLDRMRVTLKIGLKGSEVVPLRHNLDLYNDNQLERLIRKAAERLETGTSILAASFGELTEQLEQYRLDQLRQAAPDLPEKPVLSPKEHKEAQSFLTRKSLMRRTGDLLGKAGIVGEETNRLLMYVIFTSRKRSKPLHVISLGSSGTGKTHLQEKVGEMIPEEDKIEITTLSENAFYYFGRQELRQKLILIEDLDGAEGVLFPLRELQSKKRISKTVAHKNARGETKTIHLVVEGPVSVAGCTTKEEIYEDNANRSFLVYLDETEAQDKRIMDYQRKQSAGKINEEEQDKIIKLLKNTQRLLKPVKVINPYAELLDIPKEVFKPRRTNSHYLQFIEAVTFYHQYQREEQVDKQTGEVYIETTIEDIEESNRLLKEILIRKSDILTGAGRDHLERLKKYTKGKEDQSFTNIEISRAMRIALSTIKRYHHNLLDAGYLTCKREQGSKSYKYELLGFEYYEFLEKQVNTVLDKALEQLKQRLTGSPSAHQANEPVKSKKIS